MTNDTVCNDRHQMHWGILIGVAVGMLNAMIMQTMLSTSMSTICAEFQSEISYSWVYSGYVLASTMTMPLFGGICDRFGGKKNFVLGYLIFMGGTLLGWASPNMLTLIISRVVMGVGSGITVPAIYGIIGEYFIRETYKIVFAVLALITVVGKGMGSIWGSYFVTSSSWRNGFLTLLPLEILAMILILVFVTGTASIDHDTVLDVKGALLLSLSICCLLLGFDRMSEHIIYVIFIAGGAVLLAGILWWESKKDNGIIPCEIKENPMLRRLILQVFFLGLCINVAIAYVPTALQASLGMTVKASGICQVLYILGSGIGSVLGTGMKGKGTKPVWIGWLIVILGCCLSVTGEAGSRLAVYPGLLLTGLGLGILGTVLLSSAVAEAKENKATVSSLTHLTRNTGASVGVAIFGGALGSRLDPLGGGLMICGIIGLALNAGKKTV